MSRWRWLKRRLAVAAVALPLLQQGTCVDMTQRVLINGFFDWFNAALADRLDTIVADGGSDEGGTDADLP